MHETGRAGGRAGELAGDGSVGGWLECVDEWAVGIVEAGRQGRWMELDERDGGREGGRVDGRNTHRGRAANRTHARTRELVVDELERGQPLQIAHAGWNGAAQLIAVPFKPLLLRGDCCNVARTSQPQRRNALTRAREHTHAPCMRTFFSSVPVWLLLWFLHARKRPPPPPPPAHARAHAQRHVDEAPQLPDRAGDLTRKLVALQLKVLQVRQLSHARRHLANEGTVVDDERLQRRERLCVRACACVCVCVRA